MERGFAGIIVAVAMALAVWFGIQLMQMTQALDAVSIASGPQINAVVYHAEHGRWPSPGNQDIASAETNGTYVNHLVLDEGGVIIADLTLGPVQGFMADRADHVSGGFHGFLSLRPELLGSKDAPTIAFLCGYAKPVAGAIATTPANRTSLPRKFLPPFCR